MLEMLPAVEPHVLYAIGGVIVLAIASLFGLVLFASREETFEDVVAKQKKAQEALLTSLQGGKSKGKQNKKWNKLKNKKASKVKEQEEPEIDSGVDDDEPASESVTVCEPPPVITVEESPVPPTASKKKKKGKKNKAQQEPIPIPEEKFVVEPIDEVVEVDVSSGVEEIVDIEEEIEEEVVSAIEEDEVLPEASEDELPEEVALEEEYVEVPAEVEEEVPQEEPEVLETVVSIPEPELETEPVSAPVEVPAPQKKSKKKSNKPKQEVITNTVDKLESDLSKSVLSAEEIQQIMDVLVAKQNEMEQWHKPNQKSDPMEQLKRRITEVELQFAEERVTAQAIQMKNKELRLELQQERNARQNIQTEASSRLSQQSKETEGVCKRMEEKHMSEMHSANSQISRMQGIVDEGANLHMEIQRFKEDNGRLQNASMMAQQLAEDKQSLMGELTQLQHSHKAQRQELDNIILHNQQEMQNLQMAKADSENALSQRLQEVNEQVMKVEAHNRSLQQQIELLQHAGQLEQETMQMAAAAVPLQPTAEIEELNTKIEELNAKLSESEAHIAMSEASMKVVSEQIQAQSVELEDTRSCLSDAANKLAEQEAERDIEPVNAEVANLVAKVAEKEELILILEQKVAALGEVQKPGQRSPDLVVVNAADLIGSESCESFEEVTVDKEYQDQLDGVVHEQVVVQEECVAVESVPEESLPEMPEIVEDVVVVEEAIVMVESVPVETTPEVSPVETSETQIQELENEMEERKGLEKSLRESLHKMKEEQQVSQNEMEERKGLEKTLRVSLHKMKEDQQKAQEDLTEAQRILAERDSLIAEKEAVIAERESVIALKNATLSDNETAIAQKDAEIAEKMVKILELQEQVPTAAADTPAASVEATVVAEADHVVDFMDFCTPCSDDSDDDEDEAPAAAVAEVAHANKAEAAVDVEEFEAIKEELKEKTDANEKLKAKNNELREKNWKVVDALTEAERGIDSKVKDIERSVFKGLKQMFPDIRIPKCNGDFEMLFKLYGELVIDTVEQKTEDLKTEMSKVEEENNKFTDEIAELKKTNELMLASQDEVEKSQEENVHLKNVLTETESMLSRLQTGVDAEVQKWQKKVDEKDLQLEDSKRSYEDLTHILSKHGYEHSNLQTLESNLAAGQKQLMVEKEENTRIKTELDELESKLAGEKEELSKKNEENTRIKTELDQLEKNLANLAKEKEEKAAEPAANEEELTELNSKLKKTISERDLLIREYKTVKDNSVKMESELKLTKEEVTNKSQEIEKLKQQDEKDEIINKLTLEIDELKEELQQEQDCVIVDIDPDNAENLHKQVEVLSTEKEKLESKLNDIEKSYQEDNPGDTILNLESKLKAAELKISDMEKEKDNNTQKTRQNSPKPTTSSLQW